MKLLGVDPGSTTIGVAIFDIDDYKLTINNITTLTLNYSKPLKPIFSNHITDKMFRLEQDIKTIVKEENIFWLAIEAGYISRAQPSAFGPLSKSMITIHRAFIEASNSYNITEYSPSIMKSVLQTKSNHKDDMLKAVKKIKELKPFINDNQTEHEIDAIAIGYTKLLDGRKYPESFFYIKR